MGSIGKDFGSMNMDELLKNIWNAEEMQTMANSNNTATAVAGVGGTGTTGTSLQRQGSLTLPRTLSQKTVDQVWKDLSKEYNSGFGQPDLPQRQQALGEMTLEEFLFKAGVVRDEPGFGGIGFQHGAGQMQNANAAVDGNGGSNQISFQAGNMPLSGNGVRGSTQTQPPPLFPKQNNMPYGGSPAVSSDGLGKSNGGDTSSVSPTPYVFNGVFRGRKNGAIEKVVERRQRRMIKNRESAARSRARKQAYTMELEAEVSELKQKNQELKRKQEEMLKMQKNQVLEMMNTKPGAKRNRLKKTISGPW
ncbi:hypothetical protein M8C21_020991 [Ambrosia artemisiifolia]|uniref:BZIP domain-containing protein n=1 Tax=Ambrosia artemisiifolia TaxID=4212 RepID=A0AAD5C8X1_AMBAR|nr:hypothetical protein M8C21_020991 [Ambrosia artemisiifolia]